VPSGNITLHEASFLKELSNPCYTFLNTDFSAAEEKLEIVLSAPVQGSNPRRFMIFPKNGGDLCAHWVGGASTYRFCISPFLKKFCMARFDFFIYHDQ
jgi:hypothetical protein